MVSRASLEGLAAAFKGQLPREAAWLGVLDLANRGLVTPRLTLAVGDAPALPPAVGAFLQAVLARNSRRNIALAAQAERASGILNRVGVTPVLLKGAVALFSPDPARRGARMLGDLDLLVTPEETGPAIAALSDAGYVTLTRKEGVDLHAVAELARDGEPTTIDLHQRPRPPCGSARNIPLATGPLWPGRSLRGPPGGRGRPACAPRAAPGRG